MKKLLFMLLCCSIFVIGCNNVSDENFDEFEFDEFSESENIDVNNNDNNENKSNKSSEEFDKLSMLLKSQVESKEYNKALDTCENIIKILDNTDDNQVIARIYASRGQVKKYLNDLEGAMKDFDIAIDKADEPEHWFYLEKATVCEEVGKYDEALELYNKTIEMRPSEKWAIERRDELKKRINN